MQTNREVDWRHSYQALKSASISSNGSAQYDLTAKRQHYDSVFVVLGFHASMAANVALQSKRDIATAM
jgi:hypothetical protein